MSKVSDLWNKTNYILDIPYISSSYITEYDLSKANISALKYMGYLSDEDYNNLYNADKMFREVYIGKLEKEDPRVSELKAEGIKEARRKLFFENKLTDNKILSIKNDAVFVIGDINLKNDFGLFKFNKKNVYTFYMKTTSRLEIYYSYDRINDIQNIDVKGISDYKLPLHESMLTFLCQIFYMIQNNTIEDTISFYNEFYEDFINLRLDPGYYREFNADSVYRINSQYQAFGFNYIDNSYLVRGSNGISLIDLDCNLLILRDVYAVLTDIYFRNKSR